MYCPRARGPPPRSGSRFSPPDETFSASARARARVLARTAPSRLRRLIVLELLVRRIIELRLLPLVMKVDATATRRRASERASARARSDHASARRAD